MPNQLLANWSNREDWWSAQHIIFSKVNSPTTPSTCSLLFLVIAGPLWEGYRESRRCSRDTYPESYITKYTTYTNINLRNGSKHLDDVFPGPRRHLDQVPWLDRLRVGWALGGVPREQKMLKGHLPWAKKFGPSSLARFNFIQNRSELIFDACPDARRGVSPLEAWNVSIYLSTLPVVKITQNDLYYTSAWYSTVTWVNRGSTFALRRSNLDFCLGGLRPSRSKGNLL